MHRSSVSVNLEKLNDLLVSKMTCWYLRKKEKVRRAVSAVPPRFWASLLFLPMLVATLFLIGYPLNMTLIFDEEGNTVLEMGYLLDPYELPSQVGFDREGEEVISYTPGEGMILNRVDVNYSFPVELTADGESETIYIHEMTVSELLEQNEIELTEHDFAEPAFNHEIIEGDVIELFRVHFEQEEITKTIPHETNVRETSLMNRRADDVVVLLEGVDGEGTFTYENKFINNEQVESVLVEEELILEPITEEQIVYAPVSVSNYEDMLARNPNFANYPIVNGVPANYKSVLTAGRATGYYSATGRGSSGIGLFYGSCAVDPTIIPYGSLLYIASSEADSFVYGYAIATDTGTAMVTGHALVDLFYETYRESAINGVRTVNVYILE